MSEPATVDSEFGLSVKKLGPTAKWLEYGIGTLSALILFLVMVLTVVDVCGRYFFDWPVPGGYELIQFGMAGLVFFILPAIVAREDNVQIEMFHRPRLPRLDITLTIVSGLISLAVLAGFGIEMWVRGQSFAAISEVSTNLRWKLAPVAYAMSVIWFACAAVQVALICQKIGQARKAWSPRRTKL